MLILQDHSFLAPLEAPTNVNVVLQGRNTVRVTWAAPDADNVRGWALGYKVNVIHRNSHNIGK